LGDNARCALGTDLDEIARMRTRTRMFLVAALLSASACTGSEGGLDDAPSPPGKADGSDYTVTGAHAWYLVGDALTPGNDDLELAIEGPGAAKQVHMWIDRKYVKSVSGTSGDWTMAADIASLAPGKHEVLLAADNDRYAFSQIFFNRSHPLYVAVSNDWDTGDHGDDRLERQERLHARHPKMKMTHFVGPYTFTDPAVSPARAQQLVAWVKKYEAEKGDEIGLHIHPWCHFVTKAGVTCRTTPSFAYASDTSGRTVILGSYTQTELEKMFNKATELFKANGLPQPTSFRAGGWTATTDVLKAMKNTGHVSDASACNWHRLEEWNGVSNASLYPWNRENWSSIDEETQPYYPNVDDIQADVAPHIGILEVPDNGALTDYVSTAEMVEMFEKNYQPGEALTESKQYSIGYHPVSFSEEFFSRIDGALTEIDKHLAVDDKGPVIYARMSDLPKAFPQN
jgi:hypothetical protein